MPYHRLLSPLPDKAVFSRQHQHRDALSFPRDAYRLEGLFKKTALIGPRAINIHLTNQCPLRCQFCWDRSALVSGQDETIRRIPLKTLRLLIDDCARIGTNTICLEGGETMLYPGIGDLFRYIKSRSLNLEVYSNCTFAPSLLKWMVFIDKINVNMSAVGAEAYAFIHGRGDFYHRVLKNLSVLSRLKKKRGRPFIEVVFVLHEHNVDQMEAILRLTGKLGVSHVRFKLIETTHETRGLLFLPDTLRRLKENLCRLEGKRFGVPHNLGDIRSVVFDRQFMKNCYAIRKTTLHNDRYFYFQRLPDKPGPCFVAWFYAFVNVDGCVWAPCDGVGVKRMGNIYKDRFKRIWFSGQYQRLRRRAARGITPVDRTWQECRYCGFVRFNKAIAEIMRAEDKQPS